MHEIELDAAVGSGVISADTARRLRNFSATRDGTTAADEERFGTIGGLADVMTTVALVLLLGGAAIALAALGPFACFLFAALVWATAEYVTRRRRLTLASFTLFGMFALSAAFGFMFVANLLPGQPVQHAVAVGRMMVRPLPALASLVVAVGSMLACFAYWWRFQLPVAYAAGATAALNVVVHLCHLAAPETPASAVSVILLGLGLLAFLVAMWWDMSDVRRETRRADIAFWLHLLAGYQLAGASYRLLLGVQGNAAGWDRLYAFATRVPDWPVAVAALVLFAVIIALALVVDRRSLLMSSLVYVLPATLRIAAGAGPFAPVAAALVVGGFLLALATFWRPLRIAVLALLPPVLRAQVPRTDLTFERARPIA